MSNICLITKRHGADRYELIGKGHCKDNHDALYATAPEKESLIEEFYTRNLDQWCRLYIEHTPEPIGPSNVTK